MSASFMFELLKDGEVVHTHFWRSWFSPHTADEYKNRCITALNEWHNIQGSMEGKIPTIPKFDSIRFECPKGNIVVVPISHK